MAKFRTNHTKKRAGESSGMIAKVGIFSLILISLFLFLNKTNGNAETTTIDVDVPNLEEYGLDSIFFLPTSTSDQIVLHKYYALSFIEKYKLSEWVAYEMTSDRLKNPLANRAGDFQLDPKIEMGSATLDDFKNAEYEYGQLVPAADMAFAEDAIFETFYMSNIAPQKSGFKKGVWQKLAELTRDWAKQFNHVYIVCGPIFNDPINFWIEEKKQVAVPPAFYKIILDIRGPEKKGIAFIIPNEASAERIENFAISIDSVEEKTGIDFFSRIDV